MSVMDRFFSKVASVPVVHYVASLINMALRCDDEPGTV